ncbi:hypothetical protein J6O86_09175 [bacterium]|nr:hypothetical protein [bacterium]
MQINNYSSNTPNFNGVIKNTDLFKNYALEYAKGIKAGDNDWAKLKMFINTIKEIKNDGTSNEFVLDKIGAPQKQLWQIKYGNYNKQDEFFHSEIYNKKSFGHDALSSDAFQKVINFGKEHFGLGKLNMPIQEFLPAEPCLKRASMLERKAKLERNRDTSMKFAQKIQNEKDNAESLIKEAKSKLLCNI